MKWILTVISLLLSGNANALTSAQWQRFDDYNYLFFVVPLITPLLIAGWFLMGAVDKADKNRKDSRKKKMKRTLIKNKNATHPESD